MADIALLVVEEFERRRSLEKEREGLGVSPSACFSILLRGIREDLALFKEGNGEFEFTKRIQEPKTPVGLATLDGLFSA